MGNIELNLYPFWSSLSWQKSLQNLSRFQIKVFKAASVGDFSRTLSFQKLLLISNSARLIAIRDYEPIGLVINCFLLKKLEEY